MLSAEVVAVLAWVEVSLVSVYSVVVSEGQGGQVSQQRMSCRIRLSGPGR